MHGAITGVRSLPSSHSVSYHRSAAFVCSIRKRSCQKVRSLRHLSRPVTDQWQAVSSTWDVLRAQSLALSTGEISMLSGVLDKGEQHALLLSTLAGLSTSIGGAIAIVKKPGNDLLSFLLGIAIGVMATLSVLEMWLHNAFEHGPIAITAATAVGVALYYIAQPYFPDFESHQAWSNKKCPHLCLPLCRQACFCAVQAPPQADSHEKPALLASQQQGTPHLNGCGMHCVVARDAFLLTLPASAS